MGETLPMPKGQQKCGSQDWWHQTVGFECGDGIAYLTLNRPDANNSLNDEMADALHDAIFELHRRKGDIRIVVLRAEGKMFCGGADPRSFVDSRAMTDADNRKASVNFMKFLYYFQSTPQFTVALVQGSAMGTGVSLLAACDMACAVSTARFTVSEVKLGRAPVTIAPFVTRKVGQAFAKRILCAGENISAMDAKRMGLISDVVDDEMDFSKYVEQVCDKITLCAPMASSRAK